MLLTIGTDYPKPIRLMIGPFRRDHRLAIITTDRGLAQPKNMILNKLGQCGVELAQGFFGFT